MSPTAPKFPKSRPATVLHTPSQELQCLRTFCRQLLACYNDAHDTITSRCYDNRQRQKLREHLNSRAKALGVESEP